MQKNGTAPLYARITLNGQRSEISLGCCVAPEKWDKILYRVKGNAHDDLLINNQIT